MSGSGPNANMVAQKALGGPVLDVDFSDDGVHVFAACADKTVQMWNCQTDAVQQVGAADTAVRSVGWLAGHNMLASAGWDRAVNYWDTRQATPVSTCMLPERCYAMSVSKVPASPLIVVAMGDGRVARIDIRQPTQLWGADPTRLAFQLRSIQVSPDGRGFVCGSIEGRCEVRHDVFKGDANDFAFRCQRVENAAYAVNGIAFHPGRVGTIATVGADGTYSFWEKDVRKKVWPKSDDRMAPPALKKHQTYLPLTCCGFNQGGDMFAYAQSYDWSRGSAGAPPSMEGALYLRNVVDADLVPKNTPGGR